MPTPTRTRQKRPTNENDNDNETDNETVYDPPTIPYVRMNAYPVDQIRAYREAMKQLQHDAESCERCQNVESYGTNAYQASTLCVEHAAVNAVTRHDLSHRRF